MSQHWKALQWMALLALAGFIVAIALGWYYAAVVVIMGVLLIAFVEITGWTDKSDPKPRVRLSPAELWAM